MTKPSVRPHPTSDLAGAAGVASRHAQRGFSIIELMISLVLSSLVILAVVGIYSGSRETYTTQDEVGRLHENMRIGSSIVERTIRQGSYKRFPAPRDQNPMLVAAFSFTAVAGADGASTTPGDSDTVEISFNGFPPDERRRIPLGQ